MDPFAPIPQTATGGGTTPCARCGQPMDPATASYDGAGHLVCKTCMSSAVVAQANQTIERGDPRSTRNLYLGAANTVVIGAATCCLAGLGKFYFVLAPAALISGGWGIQHLLRNPETRAQLGAGYWLVLVACVVGSLFALLAIAVGFLGMIGAGMR